MPNARPGKGRGGYRTPSEPAAASGPGALSQRTDGRASEAAARGILSDTPAGTYGEKAALQQAQSNMPSGPAGGSVPPGRSAPPGRGGPGDIYGPTSRPHEPITSGAGAGAGPGSQNLLARDPHMVIRAMLAASGDPDIFRLASFYGIA